VRKNGTPKKGQAASSRDRILDAALREFANRGLFGARVDVIAKQAGIFGSVQGR
jgi:AcrR family transcriptional regulator